jgi:hypothetical protein
VQVQVLVLVLVMVMVMVLVLVLVQCLTRPIRRCWCGCCAVPYLG